VANLDKLTYAGKLRNLAKAEWMRSVIWGKHQQWVSPNYQQRGAA